jgi:peptide/nickel transport system substrate-binding protein
MALEAGDIDVSLMIYSVDYSSLKARDDIVCHKEPSVQVEYLALNVSKPPFNDIHVRKAMAYAINTDAIVEGIYEGDVAPAKSMIASPVIGYDDNVKTYEYNVEKAKEEMAKSKYPDGFEFKCYTTQSRARYVEALQYDLSVIGITMHVEYVQNVQSTIMGGYDGGHITGITFDTFDMDSAYRYLHSDYHGGGGNLIWYASPKMDELLERSRTEMDSAKRAQILSEVQDLLYQDVPVIPLFSRIATAGYVKGTKGFRPYPNEVDILVGTYVEIQE